MKNTMLKMKGSIFTWFNGSVTQRLTINHLWLCTVCEWFAGIRSSKKSSYDHVDRTKKYNTYYIYWRKLLTQNLSLCYWNEPLFCVYALCYPIWDLSTLLTLPFMVSWIIRCWCQIWKYFMQNWMKYKTLNFILRRNFLSVYIDKSLRILTW